MIMLSGTSHPTHQLQLSSRSGPLFSLFHVRDALAELASSTRDVLGGQSGATTNRIPRGGVLTDCIKWNKPLDSSTTAIDSFLFRVWPLASLFLT